jgi:hypothetical protein
MEFIAELSADYMHITSESINFNIVYMSPTNLRLDISTHSATRKNPFLLKQ